mmetsp:Transcript_6286/g.12130  ORF Transcript_6286/g.12130 Transcript_6286/m.12130 type:complete len:97 (+) Transcript_6286:962-1252(+)
MEPGEFFSGKLEFAPPTPSSPSMELFASSQEQSVEEIVRDGEGGDINGREGGRPNSDRADTRVTPRPPRTAPFLSARFADDMMEGRGSEVVEMRDD